MTLDTKSIYLGIYPYFKRLLGPFVIVTLNEYHGCIEIKLLDKNYKNFQSTDNNLPKGHASVDIRTVEQCPKVTNIHDLIKAIISHD